MKVLIFRLIKRILTILILAAAIFAAYEYISVRVKGYPRGMHLMDQQYRIIPIYLEGRTATHLHASRRDTRGYFIFEIKELHLINRWRMHFYPVASKIGKAKAIIGPNKAAITAPF